MVASNHFHHNESRLCYCISKTYLSAEELAHAQTMLADAPWADGKITAGSQSGQVKNNLQLPQHSEAGQALSQLVKAAVLRNSTFFSAVLPHTVFPPPD
jgi:PKHD-type hydroxylase